MDKTSIIDHLHDNIAVARVAGTYVVDVAHVQKAFLSLQVEDVRLDLRREAWHEWLQKTLHTGDPSQKNIFCGGVVDADLLAAGFDLALHNAAFEDVLFEFGPTSKAVRNCRFNACCFQACFVNEAEIRLVHFVDCDIQVKYQGAVFTDVDFKDCRVDDTRFEAHCEFRNTSFLGGTMNDTIIVDADVEQVTYGGPASVANLLPDFISGCDLNNFSIKGSRLHEQKFSGNTWCHSSLTESDIEACSFEGEAYEDFVLGFDRIKDSVWTRTRVGENVDLKCLELDNVTGIRRGRRAGPAASLRRVSF